MISSILFHDDERLNVRDLSRPKRDELRRTATLGGVLYWNRSGEWRKVPNAVLRDTFDVIDFWDQPPSRWRIKPPEAVGLIHWAQAVRCQTPPSQHL